MAQTPVAPAFGIMTPERHARIQSIFLTACRQTGEARAVFLAEVCGSDLELLRDIEELLAFHLTLSGTVALGPVQKAADAVLDLAAHPAPAIRPGTVVDGKLRIDGELGSGGMGTVFRATQIELDRPVAVKIIRPALPGGEKTVERLRREARAVARLRHPNVVSVFDFGISPDIGAYIVMELVDGEPLSQALKRAGRFPASYTIALMHQIAAAVQAAHDVGVVHRDLKPQNILLDAAHGAPVVKVLDFGVAKLLENPDRVEPSVPAEARELSPLLTAEGAIVGTPLYMAPEQAKGSGCDARTDVYALGCILYQMVTGEPPFRGGDAWSILCRHVDEAPKPPSRREVGVPAWLDEIILRAMAKNPDERYQSAAAFADALGAARLQAENVRAGGVAYAATDAGGVDTLDVDGVRTPNNIPAAVTSFVGREQSTDDVVAALDASPLVTLTGPAGVGKTRLALKVAKALLPKFSDGVWFVDLTPVGDRWGIARAILTALDMRVDTDDEAVDAIARRLGPQTALLVLDNCEHVVDACASFLADFLPACSRARTLTTSREMLHVYGESVYNVPGLALPDAAATPANAAASESVRLFVERACLVATNFTPSDDDVRAVAGICRRLDGLPLAIELAAARARALTVHQIDERLTDRLRLLASARGVSARHRSLRAAIDWSFDMLGETEKMLFARLSVFSGGCTLGAVEAVCADEAVDRMDVLDLLGGLVDKSLVTVRRSKREARYVLLETIREYATAKLAETGAAGVWRDRHLAYFLDLARRAYDRMRGKDGAEWGARVGDDLDNMRVALRWSRDLTDGGVTFLEFTNALHIFFYERGRLSEGRAWIESALECAGPSAPRALRAKNLTALGNIAHDQGDLETARLSQERALAIDREIGNQTGVAAALHNIGNIALLRGEFARAQALFEESYAICREIGKPQNIALSLNVQATVALEQGDAARAEALFAEAYEIYSSIDYTFGQSLVRTSQITLAMWLCRFDALPAMIDETIDLSERVDSRHNVAVAHSVRGNVNRIEGRLDEAEALFAEALATFRDLGDKDCSSLVLLYQARLARGRGDWGAAAACLAESLGLRVRLGAQKGIAECAEEAAAHRLARGDADRAARLLGAASAIRERLGAPRAPIDRQEYEDLVVATRDVLGASAFVLAFADGAHLSLADVAALSLAAPA